MTDKSDELREQLRNARKQREPESGTGDGISSGHASGSAIQYAPNIDDTISNSHQSEEHAIGSSSKPLQRIVSAISGPANGTQGYDQPASKPEGKLPGSSGSAAQNDRRERSKSGRSGKDNTEDRSNGVNVRESAGSGQSVSIEQPLILGNLVRNVKEEPFIPPRNFEAEYARQEKAPTTGTGTTNTLSTGKAETPKTSGIIAKVKRGRPVKPTTQSAKTLSSLIPGQEAAPEKESIKERVTRILPKSRTLTKQEVNELRDPLIAALTDEFQLLDKMLWQVADDELEQPIWSDMTDAEMEHFVTAMLNIGTRSGTVATIARTAVDTQDYIIAGALVAPRFQATVGLLREGRKKKLAKRRGKSL